MLYYIVYASTATKGFSHNDLVALLQQSREDNELRDITGILLYKRGLFVQLMEGEKSRVDELYHRIQTDPRHKGIFLMAEGAIRQRHFPSWRMGFGDFDSPEVKNLPGYSETLDRMFNIEYLVDNPSEGTRLLEIFKKVV